MIKSELVQIVAANNPHLYHRDVENIVHAVLDEITDALASGNRVELRGFGAFSVKTDLPAPAAIRALATPSSSRRNGCPSSKPARNCASGSIPISPTTTTTRTDPRPIAATVFKLARRLDLRVVSAL